MGKLSKLFGVIVAFVLICSANFCLAFNNNDPRNLLAKMERAMQEGARSPLQGAWIGQRNFEPVALVFTQNFCAFGVGNQEYYGTFMTQGNRLYLHLQDGRRFDFMYVLQGQTLILDNEVTLNYQPLNMQANYGVMPPNSGGNQFGGFGPVPNNPSGVPGFGSGPMPGFGSPNMLEGTWVSQTSNGTYSMIFSGNNYSFRLNNRESERGTFTYANGFMDYRIRGGRGIGKTGRYRVDFNGNAMTLTPPNGHAMTFMRSTGGF